MGRLEAGFGLSFDKLSADFQAINIGHEPLLATMKATLGHFEVATADPDATIGHPDATIGQSEASFGEPKTTIGHLGASIGHLDHYVK